MDKNWLPDIFYTMPKVANCTMESNYLKETLLDTGGRILSCGSMWDIVTKHLGVMFLRLVAGD